MPALMRRIALASLPFLVVWGTVPTESEAQGVCSIGCHCNDIGCGCSTSGGPWGSCESYGDSCAVTDCGGILVNLDLVPAPDGRLFAAMSNDALGAPTLARNPGLAAQPLIQVRCAALESGSPFTAFAAVARSRAPAMISF